MCFHRETVREEMILEFICTQVPGALAQVALGELPEFLGESGGCPELVVYGWVTEQRAKYHGRA